MTHVLRPLTLSCITSTTGQVDGILQFTHDADVLQTWDEKIDGVCKGVNACLETISKLYPACVVEE